MKKHLWTILLVMLWQAVAGCASAADSKMPIVYATGKIAIQRNNTSAVGPAGDAVALPKTLTLPVEIRDAMAFYQQDGWFNLAPIKQGQGLLLLFETPIVAPIAYAAQYAPMDIAMVDKNGTITAIAPSLVLAKLESTLYPNEPVKAFLMFVGGTCEQLFIQPGDEVIYEAFKPPVPMLDMNNPVATKPLAPGQPTRLETPEQKVQPGTLKPDIPAEREEQTGDVPSPSVQDVFDPEPAKPARRKPSAQP